MQIVEVVLLLVLVYTWIAYPLLLFVLEDIIKSTKQLQGKPSKYPQIAVIFSAYNEEKVIHQKLENMAEALSEYNKLSTNAERNLVLLGIDGATDNTARIAHKFAEAHREFRVIEFHTRRGKIAVLKDIINLYSEDKENKAEIFVFTDANTMFKPRALELLIQPFSDPAVGCVCGHLKLIEPSDKKHLLTTEHLYWRDESYLKEMESELNSCTSVNGAIYAIRSELFWRAIPDNTIVEDFVIGMKVREHGYQIRFIPDAVGEEIVPSDWKSWWRRRVRIGTGNYQALWLCRRCLLPDYGIFAWMFWSHKVLRWFTPHMLLILFVINLFECILALWFRTWTLISIFRYITLIISVVGVLAGRLLHQPKTICGKVVRVFSDFVMAQLAFLYGFWKACCGDINAWWEPTAR